MSQTSLSRLSVSHIRYIFQFFEDSELYDISFTCLRLHEPALLVLLSRRNIPDPLEKVEIRLGEIDNTLQALRVALFLPSIKQISVSFSQEVIPGMVTVMPFPPLTVDQLQTTTVRLLDEMNRLQRLLQKLQTVGDITLILPGSLEWNIRDVNLERGDIPDLFSWFPLINLLQETVQKHCISLRVTTSPFWSYGVTRPTAAKGRLVPHLVRKVFKRTRDTDMSALARWEGITYRPHSIPPTVVLRSPSCLTHFYIQTTLLLFPGTAGWTFSVLKHSPIASLHISGLNISQSDWGPIASKIADAAPGLLELDFDDEEIEPDCLVRRLLNRLTRLTSLKIGPRMSVYLTYPRIFSHLSSWYLPAFRSLTKLSAPAPYVSLFLMRPHPLPALTSLEIPPTNIWKIATHHHTLIYLHLPKILRRLRDINHILYPLPVTISSEWRGHETSFLLAQHIDTSLALDPVKSDALREITHLVLEDFNSSLHPQCNCVYHWLKLFPSLQQISWQGTTGHRHATDTDIPRLAREISRSSPTVKNLIVNGTHYSICRILTSADEGPGLAGGMSSTLVDLPPEVLLSIFEFLDAELLSLSVLCRRLHFLALPLFLGRHSIPAPSEKTLVNFDAFCTPDDDVLRALTITLFVPSIEHLSCVFPDPTYIYRHLESIRRVTRLVKRLERVGKLSLEFYPNHFRLNTSIPKFYSENRVWELCYDALRDLMQAIGDKLCTSLSVIGCPVPVSAPFQSASIRIDSITDLHLAVDYSATPYSWWMFFALKNSPISSLKLDITADADLDAVDFAATLTTLSLKGGYVPTSAIVEFLRRHPRISNLTLPNRPSRNDPSTSTTDVARRLRLDDLVALCAPPAYILHFLQTCDPFPALQRIMIVLDDLPDSIWALTSIIERIHETYSSPPVIAVEIVVPLDVNLLTRSVGHISFMGGKWTHATRHIVALAVECDWDWFGTAPGYTGLDPGVVHVLLNWFTSFKGLRRISIEGPAMFIPSESDTLVGFAESLRRQLPALETIHFNQHTLFER
ncbi:hypothetical protein C8F04DRAFT_1394206 [Mycena alexandri]|uniref:F-box domain-containing protein n=1 Tax=Mycena alexandri TaxID=1745969 RepID=A0AAD6T2D4_9AGAR|nr:hypothetical protein C8F04DRAFT_1394206 [Mycena alexandri]